MEVSAGKPVSESDIAITGDTFSKTMPLRTNDIYFLVLTPLGHSQP